jgi:nucleotide-binding universal stress UspA family protein
MDFFRRSDKHHGPFDYARVLVPLVGDELVDDPALIVAALLLVGREGAEVSLLHAEKVLAHAVTLLEAKGLAVRPLTVQARAAGPAIVDDALEIAADLIVMGLRYKKRFGGQWDAGRTVPYVMRNSTAPVWCLRAETKELAHTP